MSRIQIKSLSAPDEVRAFADRGHAEIFTFGGHSVGRAVFEPGWRWSEHVKPLAGTESCQASHACFVLAGHMHLVDDDGGEAEVGPGDFVFIEPGHDAWVLGDQPCVMLDFAGLQDYARPQAGRSPPPAESHPTH